jgi:hypothetical protein
MESTSLPLLELAAKHAVPMLAMLELAVTVLELAVVAVTMLELAVPTIAMSVTTMTIASKGPMSTVPAMAMRKLVCSVSSCGSGGTSS